MSIALRLTGAAPRGGRSQLQLHRPAEGVANSTRWLINGFPATVLIWSAEEWARMIDRPEHAQQSPSGLWCLLKFD